MKRTRCSLSISLSLRILNLLNVLAEEKDTTVSAIIGGILEKYFADQNVTKYKIIGER